MYKHRIWSILASQPGLTFFLQEVFYCRTWHSLHIYKLLCFIYLLLLIQRLPFCLNLAHIQKNLPLWHTSAAFISHNAHFNQLK